MTPRVWGHGQTNGWRKGWLGQPCLGEEDSLSMWTHPCKASLVLLPYASLAFLGI